MSQRKIIPPEILLECYRRNEGNKRATARELGVDKDTVRNSLALYGFGNKPVVGGSTKAAKHNVMPLPEEGKIKRYLLTSAQSNTKAFVPFLKNLEAYAEWLGDCRIMVSRFTYNRNAFHNPAASKVGHQAVDPGDCWFDPLLDNYIVDDPERHGTCRWQLAPDLWFAAEFQIEPTAERPLSGLGTLTGTASCVFPHVKVALEAVPSLLTDKNPYTKHVYTTGTVTGRNYIKRKAGLKAEFHHTFAALMVEVDHLGNFWCRQLVADNKGSFHDIPEGNVVQVIGGEIVEGLRAEAWNPGDTHVEELPEERKQAYWGPGGVKDKLKPKYEFHNDLQSFRARSHHEMKSFESMLKKFVSGQDKVDKELDQVAEFLSFAERDYCTTIVVPSNHDKFGSRWLDEASYKSDLTNCEYFLEAQLARVRSIKAGEEWSFLSWACRRAGAPETVRFLDVDESFVICKNHPIECGLHGDLGPNGSRGSTNNLTKIGHRLTKGHSHVAEIRDGVYSAGVCSLKHSYNFGPTSWSVSHVVTFSSGKRMILSERAGKLWA